MSKRALVATVALASSLFLSALTGSTPAQAQDNGASRTPPMGWSSWSSVRTSPTEAKIKAQAQAMHDSGLMSAGYQYINLDDYYIKNPGTTVDQYGRWVVDTGKFPDGMKNLGDFIHGLGEKFGMYVTPGIPKAAYDQNTPIEGTSYHARDIVSSTSTFESNYGGFGNVMYFIDYNKNPTAAQAFVNSWANLFASYGVDYIKIDGVHTSDQNDVIAWSKALNQTGRTIHLGLSNTLDINNIKTWQQYSNSWRTGGDIECYCSTLTTWSNVGPRWANLAQWGQYAGPGGWNDPDSIEVGNGDHNGLTVNERQSVITLWAITRSVMMLGSDLTNLDAGDLNMLKNAEVTNVNQTDSVVASQISNNNDLQVWATKQKNPDGSYTVALFNRSDRAGNETVTADFSDLGFSGSATVRNLWGKSNETLTNSVSRSLAPHESALFKVTPSSSSTPVGGNLTSGLSGRCADDPNSTLVNGTQLDVWDCNGGANQKITYSSSAKTLKVLGKCFDAHGGATTAGTHVEIYDCNGGTNQQWNVNSNGTITGVQSGLCLDVTGATNPNGAGLELWNCNGGANQTWTLASGVKVA
ncbi:glycoside hydrolase family 27 protein [Actinacidiphila paucisporea]|uniref:Alpha-galactosidase n=1 Tax=Actinacidiphila paucisporea TaxID=310782 RepID=A0A1M7ICI9_9ACTN|nr:glycoside hydrolase family 27 protein [Actinacidiphila paucisporea]SHM38399.1 Alpha galactosidase A [Actinacidiphila paucisporea]